MSRTWCHCGQAYVDHGGDVTVFSFSCGDDCQRESVRKWLATQPWFVRLDEWQHRHAPKWPHAAEVCEHRHPLATVWDWLWRPLCACAEKHHTGMWRPR